MSPESPREDPGAGRWRCGDPRRATIMSSQSCLRAARLGSHLRWLLVNLWHSPRGWRCRGWAGLFR
jgi:hypothetical protein